MSLLTDLQAWWKLDEASGSRLDSYGVNNLTDNNTVTQATGKVNDAAEFNPANSEFLSIADNAALSAGNNDFTICAWAYIDDKTATRVIVAKGNWITPTGREYRLDYVTGTDRFRFTVRDAADTSSVAVNANALGSPSVATWYFIVCWHDSVADTINIQINNGTVNSAAHSTGVNDGTADFRIGTSDPTSEFWDGRIDEVAFWRRTLTTQERTDLYNSGNGVTIEDVIAGATQTISAETFIQITSTQTISADTDLLTNQATETITADTDIAASPTQTIDAVSTILTGIFTQTISADTDLISAQSTQTINAETFIQATVEQTILSESFIQVLGNLQVIGANSVIMLQSTQTIGSNTDILARAVELSLYKESDLSTQVGTPSNPLDFGTVDAGDVEVHPDNPFILFNDKGGVLGSFDAREVTISVLQLDLVDELQGNSDGSPSQVFVVAFPPVVDVDDLITVKVNNIPWTRVSTFAGFQPTDQIYTFNATTGTVTFGDGTQGAIPTIGFSIKVSYTPDTILFGKQAVDQLWVGVQSNGVLDNDVTVELEERLATDTTHVQVIHHPKVVSVSGVWLSTDPNRLGTNYFTGGGFDDQSGIVLLGTALPSVQNVLVDYEYTIQDDAEGGFTPISDTITHTFANPIPSNNGKRLNFLVNLPDSASSSGGGTIKFKLRFAYIE